MSSTVYETGIPADMATGPYTAALPEIEQPADDTKSPNTSDQQQPMHFKKSESKSLGFMGNAKDIFSGKKLVSTLMTMGFLFTWSERVLTYFRTGFSLYRDPPHMITGRNLEGKGRLDPLKTAALNTKKLFIPGSDNNFVSQYTPGEKLEALATVGGVAQNLWFLFSSREGDIPEGDTWLQRFKHVFQNPRHHVAQITAVWMIAVIGLLSYGRVIAGVDNLSRDAKGNKIGFNPHNALTGLDRISKTEKLMPLIAGAALLISAPLTLYGLINIKKPSPDENASIRGSKAILGSEATGALAVEHEGKDSHVKPFASSKSETQRAGVREIIAMLSPSNMKEIASYAIKHDPIGLTGRILAFGLDIGSFGMGLARLKQIESGQYAHKFGATNSPEWKKAHALAKQTRNVGILGFVLTGLYSTYVYDTVMHAYKKEQQAVKTGNNNAQMAR